MGSHQAIMRILGSILCCGLLCDVWSAPNYHRRYENMQRSLRHPWYRNTDESIARRDCPYWKRKIQDGDYLSATSEHGWLCMKIEANIKLMSWCNDWNGKQESLYVKATILDTRASNIYPCEILDVTLIAKYRRYPAPINYCKIIRIDGVLWCVDLNDMIDGDESMSLIPEWYEDDNGPRVDYNLCGYTMGQYCSEPLLVQTLQPLGASIKLGGCSQAASSC